MMVQIYYIDFIIHIMQTIFEKQALLRSLGAPAVDHFAQLVISPFFKYVTAFKCISLIVYIYIDI